jgi:hypothetical protein
MSIEDRKLQCRYTPDLLVAWDLMSPLAEYAGYDWISSDRPDDDRDIEVICCAAFGCPEKNPECKLDRNQFVILASDRAGRMSSTVAVQIVPSPRTVRFQGSSKKIIWIPPTLSDRFAGSRRSVSKEKEVVFELEEYNGTAITLGLYIRRDTTARQMYNGSLKEAGKWSLKNKDNVSYFEVKA